MKPRNIVLTTLLTFSLLLVACGTSTPDPVAYTIELSEYAFSPADLEFQVGQAVTLTLINVGALDHELMIGNHVMESNGQPSSYEKDFFNTGGVTPVVTGGGMLMSHGDEHDDDMDMGEDGMETGDDSMDMEDDSMDMEDDHDEEGMDMDDDHDDDGDDHAAADDALMVMIPVGADTTTVTFTVTEDMVGDWEIGCFELEGVHYTAGMVGSVTVSP